MLSSARVPALEADLDAQRAGRRQSEAELDAFKEGAREITNLKESSARESEEIVGALQGQVESSNKVCVPLFMIPSIIVLVKVRFPQCVVALSSVTVKPVPSY